MSPILQVEDLKVTFRVGSMLNRQDIQAVAGVSFDVSPGETFALVGESGSGKTTLARGINGLQRISNGSVTFGGQRIDTLSTTQMKPLRRTMGSVLLEAQVSAIVENIEVFYNVHRLHS